MYTNPSLLPPNNEYYDIQWDPEVMRKYGGNWVAAVGREVIAFGKDRIAVRAEAAAKLGVDPATLRVTAILSFDSIW